jgi:methylated-DNA-[protein]-cysteine S-methyltransferase
MERIEEAHVRSPIGSLGVFAREGVLIALDFDDGDHARRVVARRFPDAEIVGAPRDAAFAAALRRYLEGDLAAIDAVAVDPGGTAFQARVWKALRRIPCGRTTSYGALARRLGEPNAMRAVGLANGQNPIAIVIPCHRVIGKDGSLTGYGGGLERKRWLLRHEGALPPEQAALFP